MSQGRQTGNVYLQSSNTENLCEKLMWKGWRDGKKELKRERRRQRRDEGEGGKRGEGDRKKLRRCSPVTGIMPASTRWLVFSIPSGTKLWHPTELVNH